MQDKELMHMAFWYSQLRRASEEYTAQLDKLMEGRATWREVVAAKADMDFWGGAVVAVRSCRCCGLSLDDADVAGPKACLHGRPTGYNWLQFGDQYHPHCTFRHFDRHTQGIGNARCHSRDAIYKFIDAEEYDHA